MKSQRGFAVGELIVVLTIIGAFAAVAVGIVVPWAQNASRTARFRSVSEPFKKHFQIALNDRVIDVSKPFTEWIPEDEKALTRPFVAKHLKAVCEDAAGELAGYQKVKKDILTAALDAKLDLNRGLDLLAAANKGIAYFTVAAGDGGTSCKEARKIAGTLDLL